MKAIGDYGHLSPIFAKNMTNNDMTSNNSDENEVLSKY